MNELMVGVAVGDPMSTDAASDGRGGPLVPSLQPFTFLHQSERQLVGPRATDKRRGDFVRGRWIVKRVISELVHVPFGPGIHVLRDARGAPEVHVQDLSGSAVKASISHTTGLAAAAAVRSPFEVGVDVERWLQMPEAIARDYFTPDEVQLYRHHASRSSASALIWSLKESMLKVLGEGLRMSTLEVEVLGWTSQADGSDWGEAQVQAPTPDGYQMRAWIHEEEGWVLTLAVLEPTGRSLGQIPGPIARCPFTKEDLAS